jgi:hypothetical protein
MTLSSLRDSTRTVTPHTTRFPCWGGWLVFLLLAGQLIFCHGCHGDEDNELCVPPRFKTTSPDRERRAGKPIARAPDSF